LVILETRGLSFAYGATPVLEGIDIRIGPGITAIIGPNAAGKSTLLKCLSGLLKPRGQVSLDGRKLAEFRAEELTRLVSYLPQDSPPRAALTVFETVLLGRLHRLGLHISPQDVRCVEHLLGEMGLVGLASRYIGELSGGQVQMVAIAQALAREPTALL
jgi:iron complex transport system ATP-binding protein